jgi:uncharacterized membrane protein YbaN (DUF454 family)
MDEPMYRDCDPQTASWLRRCVGLFCLGLGFVGLLLPLLPGIPLLIVGAHRLTFRHLNSCN